MSGVLSRRVMRLSLWLMAIVTIVYAAVQVPVALMRAAQTPKNPAAAELVSMLVGTLFVTLNVPLAWLCAAAQRRRRLMIVVWTIAMFALQPIAVTAQNAVVHLFWPAAVPLPLSDLFPVAIVLDSATAVALLCAVLAIAQHEAATAAAVRADRLRAIAREEDARVLLAQLEPHFLFNTLNAISALIAIDAVAAKSMVAQLRTLIEQHVGAAAPVWTVAEELHVVSTYLEIERRRLGDRLAIDMDVDRSTDPLPFPRLLLQPLVENAVRHGVRRGGRVSVRIERKQDDLHATVRDATDRGGAAMRGHGVGLANVRARLELLYGARHRFEIATTGDGTTVHLRLPVI